MLEKKGYIIQEVSVPDGLLQRIIVEQLVISIDRPIFYRDDSVWYRAVRREISKTQFATDPSNGKGMLEINVIYGEKFEPLLTEQREVQARHEGLAIKRVRQVPNVVIFELIERIRDSAIEYQLVQKEEPVGDQYNAIVIGDQLRNHQIGGVSHRRKGDSLVCDGSIVELIEQLIHSSLEPGGNNQMLRFENSAASGMNDR